MGAKEAERRERIDLREDVRMGQGDPSLRPARAGRVDDRRRIVWLDSRAPLAHDMEVIGHDLTTERLEVSEPH